MGAALEGSTIKVHYTGRLADGTIFDSSEGREPLEVTLGTRSVIPGFEKGLMGLKAKEKKTIEIPAEEGYGHRNDEMMMEVTKADFPDDITPEVGVELQMQMDDGQDIPMKIIKIEDQKVTLDANHPLAGKTLIFEVEVVEVS